MFAPSEREFLTPGQLVYADAIPLTLKPMQALSLAESSEHGNMQRTEGSG